MPLTSRAKNKLIADVNELFSLIGQKMPIRSTNNGDPIAYEYFIASHLAKIAEGRRDNAKAVAIRAKLIPDTDDPKQARDPGTDEIVFDGGIVTITLAVSKPRTQVDVKALSNYLIDHKVKPALIVDAIDAASKPTKAGHRFTAILNTSGSSDA